VHKKMLAVVVLDVASDQWQFERRRFGTTVDEVIRLREWLERRGVREVVMESTAQYWRTVWWELEEGFELHLAQAHSNRARRGRKADFKDADRLLLRHVAGELIPSFVPGREQREWRMMTRMKVQLPRDRCARVGPPGPLSLAGERRRTPRGSADSRRRCCAWPRCRDWGPQAATFDSPRELASWVGVCPGQFESADKN